MLRILETAGYLDFQITNMRSFSPIALAAAIPVRLSLLFFFFPETLFPFEVICLIWETLMEKMEVVGIENIFQLKI